MSSFIDDLWDDAGQPLIEEMCGTTVTFRRGAATIAGITAVADSVDYTVIADGGVYETFTRRDYTLRVEDLVIDDVAIKPRQGDRITEVVNGVEQTFEIVPIDDNRPAVQLLPTGKRYLVHGKQVS